MAEMILVPYEGRSMMMSAYAAETTPPPPANRRPDGRTGEDRQLHAQDNDRVYQAAGDQYIFDRAVPAAAAANTLPRDIAAFTGRNQELNDLISTVTELVSADEIIPVYTVSGMPGVGKTKFAVHAAHQLSASFPDGQLFIDLHAHTASKKPVEPADALFALLSAAGVLNEEIPDDIDGRSALWRARMAGRRSILLLDNVATHGQVEPLLPGARNCLIIVTSRRRLTGLGARHAAAALPLSPLPPGQAADLFARLTDRTPDGVEEPVVAELVRLCGYLPLAISLLAARLRPEPQWHAQALVDEMAAARDRLSCIRAEDIQVKAAFGLSYQRLPPARRRLFRTLGLSPGTDIDVFAAAALGGVGLPAARRHLEALYDDHLVDQPVQGRYRLHDLLGAYARALVAKDPAWQRDQATKRLLDYYEHAAVTADRQIAPKPDLTTSARSPSSLAIPALAGGAQAAAWMGTELPNLLACASYAMSEGDDSRLVSMSAALATFLRRTGSCQQPLALHRAAADAARRLGDRRARATALYHVGVALRRAGDYPAAMRALSEARGLHRDLDDQVGEVDVLIAAGTVRRLVGDYLVATEMLEEALARVRGLDDTTRQAEVISELGVIRGLTEDYSAATGLLEQALTLHRSAGNRLGQAHALLHLAAVWHLTHEYVPATRALEQAMTLYESLGSQLGLAHTQFMLGVVRRLTGNHPGGARVLAESLRVYREIGDRLGEANTLTEMGIVRRLTVDNHGAMRALQEALSLYRRLGNRRGQASTLQELGVVRQLTGDTLQGTEDLTEALTIYRSLGNRAGQATVLNHLGALLLDKGDPQAVDRFEEAVRHARDGNDALEEARALEGIARCYLGDGDTRQRVAQLQVAMEIYERIGAPDAARVRATILSLNVDQ